MANYISYQEMKEKVTLQQVVEAAGFKWDKKSGRTQPEFKRGEDPNNQERIIIKNIGKENEHYWSRSGNLGGGDVINFIKNDINTFANIPGVDLSRDDKNAFLNINAVLSHFANIPFEASLNTYNPTQQAEKPKFDPERYVPMKTEVTDLGYLTASRHISPETVEKFLPFITLIRDKQVASNYLNVGFPYHEPGKQEVTGYDIRNNGFKGMAAGTDKENSAWIATTASNPAEVKRLFFFESPIDAMSFYEIKGKNLLHDSAFISIGGQMHKNQIQNILKEYPQARINTAYDNDVAGRVYDVRTYMAAQGKDLTVLLRKESPDIEFQYDNKSIKIPKDELTLDRFKEESGIRKKFGTVYKSQEGTKDWNDQLTQNKKAVEEKQVEKETRQVKL